MLPARLSVEGEQVHLRAEGTKGAGAKGTEGTEGDGSAPDFSCALADVTISPRLGSTPRYLRFAGRDGRLEIAPGEDSDWLDQRIGRRGHQVLDRLERHTLLALAAGLVVLSLGVAYFVWGIPAIARVAAQQMPADLMQRVGRETLEVLHSQYLVESELSQDEREAVRELFRREIPDFPLASLHLAGGGELGANALALPDGAMVLTDELVALTESDAELLAVIGHELGHIEEHHAVRQMLQGTAIGVTIALVGGDVSALGDILLAMPVIFTQLHYSRRFELEADQYALDFLRQRGIGREPFAAILTRLHHVHSCDGEEAAETETETETEAAEAKADKADAKDSSACGERGWVDYLSTHPHIEQRLEAL